MIETLSVSFACDVEHAHNHVNCTSFHVGLNYMINLICSRIYDAFDQNFMCFVHYFIVGLSFLLIDCLDSPVKLYCSTDFLVEY